MMLVGHVLAVLAVSMFSCTMAIDGNVTSNETKAVDEMHNLKCENFKVSIRLLKPPSEPRGSEGYDKMECNICENVRLIYRCYPCFQSLKFLGLKHLPDNTTAATFVMKFGCEGRHLRVLESILKNGSIVSADCFEAECPPESPEIHLVQPCITPAITQCSTQVCQAPETYSVTPYPTDCPPAVPPQIPMIPPHEPKPIPAPQVIHHITYPVANSPYPDPYNHVTEHYVHTTVEPPTDGHQGEAPQENHKEQDKQDDEKPSDEPNQEKENKEENKPAQPQAVGVFGQTFVNGQLQPTYPPVQGNLPGQSGLPHLPYPLQQPLAIPGQVPAPVPYPFGACHPNCAHSCSMNCHPACCRSKFAPKTRYRAYLQKLKAIQG